MDTYIEFLDNKVFELLAAATSDLDIDAYVVGGYVRDKIMGRNCVDIDVVAVGSGIDLAIVFPIS